MTSTCIFPVSSATEMLASSRYLKLTQQDQPELTCQGFVSFKGSENQMDLGKCHAIPCGISSDLCCKSYSLSQSEDEDICSKCLIVHTDSIFYTWSIVLPSIPWKHGGITYESSQWHDRGEGESWILKISLCYRWLILRYTPVGKISTIFQDLLQMRKAINSQQKVILTDAIIRR